MKVLLVANYQPDAQQSMLRYAEFLRDGLAERGCHVELVQPPAIAGRLVGRNNPLFKWLGYLDKFVLFPFHLRLKARRAELVHICDHSNSGYLRWTGKTPTIITVHDVLAIRSGLGQFPQNPTGRTGRWLQRWILSGLESARHVISVSQKTKLDLETLLVSKPQIQVIHHALNWEYAPAPQSAIDAARSACGLGEGDEYLFHVGGNQWYKNRIGVMRIVAELRKLERFRNIKLILAGKPWTKDLRAFQRQHLPDNAIELIAPSNEQIQALYSDALAFLFPSLEEGFGWPILEAQACQCLVITSDRPPMTEIAGEGAIFVEPDNPIAAAATINARLVEAGRVKQQARENLKRYLKDEVITRYHDAYTSLIREVGR